MPEVSVSITCFCCNHTTGKLILKGLQSVYSNQPCDIAICDQCGNGITLPIIAKDELSNIYSSIYLYPVHKAALGEKKYRAKKAAEWIRKEAPSNGNLKSLEIGCMFGYLLEELSPEYKVKGIDIGEEAILYCKRKGLAVQDIGVEAYLEENDETFDVIILSHVLEHLIDPLFVLKELRKRLNPNGQIFILVPNRDSFCRKLFGRYWGWWQVPVHIHHFNLKALHALGKNADYHAQSSQTHGGDSLMLILNMMNLLGMRSRKKMPGKFGTLFLSSFSRVFKYWYAIGNEELCLILKKDH